MLLAVDVGNTNIVLGLFNKNKLDKVLRVATESLRTASEYGMLFREMIPNWPDVAGVSISSVVPPVNPTLQEVCQDYLGKTPFFVNSNTDLGITLKVDFPEQVGVDRLVNAAAAYSLYGGPIIILDLGTATTICAVSARGEYLGGAILPGIGVSMEALFNAASKLPRVELARPPSLIGTNTIASMQSGIYFGYVGMMDGLVDRFQQEMGEQALVVATGGFSPILAEESVYIKEINPHLTLEGLKMLYEKNRRKFS